MSKFHNQELIGGPVRRQTQFLHCPLVLGPGTFKHQSPDRSRGILQGRRNDGKGVAHKETKHRQNNGSDEDSESFHGERLSNSDTDRQRDVRCQPETGGSLPGGICRIDRNDGPSGDQLALAVRPQFKLCKNGSKGHRIYAEVVGDGDLGALGVVPDCSQGPVKENGTHRPSVMASPLPAASSQSAMVTWSPFIRFNRTT